MRNDADLLESACRGDQDAQGMLFASRIDPLVRLAYLITRDHAAAEDAVQEALLSTTRHLPTLREHDRFDAWLRRIVVNQARTLLRRGARLIPTEDVSGYIDRADERAPGPEETLLLREEQTCLLRAVDTLSENLRVPIVMRYYLDMKEKDIAQAMGLPASTIKSRLHAARLKLRQALQGARKEE
ncbi:MAG: RNA polymerase sigma factor [Oscillospiraceae bacterium]|jgi:RNA polymerase sigma-70 factor (ECF subfamily)|nr:RNA polymerase sigma factor [Oscillospiraceae bacterium]